MGKLFSCFLAAATLISANAFAKTETYTYESKAALRLVEILEGKTLVCVQSEAPSKGAKKNTFYPIRISAEKKDAKTALITTSTGNDERFGFGGENLTNVEITSSWVHLSVGDDGRREFMFQHYPGFTKDNKCDVYKGQYSGEIAGINSTIWDAGNITAEGIQCCLE